MTKPERDSLIRKAKQGKLSGEEQIQIGDELKQWVMMARRAEHYLHSSIKMLEDAGIV